MAQTIDISGRLTNERPKLKLGKDLVFEVDNRKNTVFKVEEVSNSPEYGDLERFDVTLKLLLGEEAAQKIDALDLSFADYQYVFIAAMATATGEKIEDVEARFQAAK